MSSPNKSPNKEGNPPVANTTKLDTPLDFSFMKLITPQDLANEIPRGAKEKKSEEKYKSKCIKLNNNHFNELTGFSDWISQTILEPDHISWIDLSFNDLSKIDPVLCDFPSLQILYLHGNAIGEIGEVDKLSKIVSLKKLALHGNPLETTKNYRWYVLSQLPHLVSLDMSAVTKADRATASALFNSSTTIKKKKKPTSDY
jgi:Leucine-rich repeat (LRR) protein